MRVVFTRHALERMRGRPIPVASVRKALQFPNAVKRTDGEMRFVLDEGAHVLVVIARPVEDGYLIITAFRSSHSPKKRGRKRKS